jgi:hypothetical protein
VDLDRQTEQGPAERERLTGDQRRAERRTAVALAVAILAGIGLFIVYFAGGQTQVEGVLFCLILGGLGPAGCGDVLEEGAPLAERRVLVGHVADRRGGGVHDKNSSYGMASGRRSESVASSQH